MAALELADEHIYATMYPGKDVATARHSFRKRINELMRRRGVVLTKRPTPASVTATEGAEQADVGRKSKWRLAGQDLSGNSMMNIRKRLGARTAKTVPGTKNEEMQAEMKSLENAEKRRSAYIRLKDRSAVRIPIAVSDQCGRPTPGGNAYYCTLI
jgi:hypothetical protein